MSEILNQPHLKDHFMGFLEAEESTGQHLASNSQKIRDAKIPFEGYKWKSHDNGDSIEMQKQRCPSQTPGH